MKYQWCAFGAKPGDANAAEYWTSTTASKSETINLQPNKFH